MVDAIQAVSVTLIIIFGILLGVAFGFRVLARLERWLEKKGYSAALDVAEMFLGTFVVAFVVVLIYALSFHLVT